MAFDNSDFQPIQQSSGGFTPDDFQPIEQPKTLAGLGQNAIEDTKGVAEGLGQALGGGSQLPSPLNIPFDLYKGGKQAITAAQHPMDTLKGLTEPIRHPIEYGYQHPVSQTLNVLGAAEGTGLTDTMGQYAKRFGQNQAMKAMGGMGGQIGQVGIPESRQIAQTMIDKGAISPLRGPIGMEEYVDKLHSGIGQDIGTARTTANARGDAPQMAEILDQVNKNLNGKYGSGVDKSMATLNRAKEEIAKGGTGTFTGNAQKATDLNSAASANKIYRPQGATTDVADVITGLNKDKMRTLLSPEEMAQHEKDLSDYGQISKAKEFMKRGERKEMAGRGGASLTKTMADKTMDALGNRLSATLGSKIGDILQSPITKSFDAGALANYLRAKYDNQQD